MRVSCALLRPSRGVICRVKPLQVPRSPGVRSRAMRTLVALALVALVACGGDPLPLTNCTAGVSTACACSSGATGAQVCAANGSGYGACVCTSSDASVDAAPTGDVVAAADGAADVPGLDVAVDGGADAVAVADASDGSADAGDVPTDNGCNPGSSYCAAPSAGCFDLQTEVIHCGRCHNFCSGGRSRCVGGECVP